MCKYNEIILFYFSGTGNAKQIALWFTEFAQQVQLETKIYDISKIESHQLKHINSNSLIIFISPIHGFNYPKITLDFIAHFPKGKNKIVLMNTRAGMKLGRFVSPGLTGVAFFWSSLVLKRKGYKIIGQIPFDMPSNWISIHPALGSKSVKYLHRENYKRVENHFNKIVAGKSDFLAYRDLIQDVFIAPVSLLYYFIGKYLFAKSFYATADCNNCEICVNQCPVKAIKLVHNRPFWTHKCESCMKCMNLCPNKSIETAHGLIIVICIISALALSVLVHNVFDIHIESGFVSFLLWSVMFFIFLMPFYRIQHFLLRYKPIARWISFASLSHYKFWGRYRSIPDYKWKYQDSSNKN